MSEQKNITEAVIEDTGGALSAAETGTEIDNGQTAPSRQELAGTASAPSEPSQDDTRSPSIAADVIDSENGYSAPSSQKDDIVGVVRETVAQTLATLGITSDTGVRQPWLEMEKLIGQIARSPDDIKSKLESLFAVLLERLEDPKGVVGYNRQKRFFMDLLSLYDLMRELEDSIEAAGADVHRANYRNLKEHLLQLLALNGVTPVVAQIGSPFSPQQHRVIKVVQTDDSSQDGCIDSIVRDGFAFGPFTLRPTEVVVKKRVSGGIA